LSAHEESYSCAEGVNIWVVGAEIAACAVVGLVIVGHYKPDIEIAAIVGWSDLDP